MKRLFLVFTIFVFTSCSFDNKTGIWKDISDIPVDTQAGGSVLKNEPGKRYEDIFTKNKTFSEEKESINSSIVKIDKPIKIANWFEKYGTLTNNISNFSYSDQKILLSKSSKLSNFLSGARNPSAEIVFYNDNLISYDHKGKIFIYSLSLKKKTFEYNFYKKKFKGFKKNIYLTINKNVLYAADNLGYIYALNLDDKSIVWAKNFGIPFRSNLKFQSDQIFVANQDNKIYSINSNTGKKNWEYPTSLTYLKSDFENNFALNIKNNDLFFFNTSGELYSIDYQTQKVNWVLNFKSPSLTGDTELFLGQPIVFKKNDIFVTTEKALLSYNTLTATRNWIIAAEPIFKPIITSNYTYAILKNDLLICLENTTGNIVWSKNIFKDIQEKKVIKNFKTIIDFKVVNGKINMFSKNGFLLTFNPSDGNLIYSERISKNGIASEIIFLGDNMLFVDNRNKLLKFN